MEKQKYDKCDRCGKTKLIENGFCQECFDYIFEDYEQEMSEKE